ncbi:MAG: hypothetical protein AUI86_10830 [Gemmatimonadetes bacterium 13_1_40CM_3_66_12]|nr:MAG: hypothetical protein AUI86_10830 [Gemmatimonadetes bacterium 13_1_40CM_3_66_12]
MRPADDGARQRCTLPFALRERVWHAIEHTRDAEACRCLHDSPRDLRVCRPAHLERKCDVLADAQVGIQRGSLEHHRHVTSPRRITGHDTIADQDVATGGLFQAGNAA